MNFNLFDWIMDFLYDMVSIVILLLPESPIQKIDFGTDFAIFADVMSYINYFVPVAGMLGMLTIYLASILIWYGCRWVLRLAQYI